MRLPCWLIGHSYGPVNEQRYQICGYCGTAKAAPCPHDWKILEKYDWNHHRPGGEALVGVVYSIQCKKCGEIEKRTVGVLS